MSLLELQVFRAKVFNKVITIKNPNNTKFKGDPSFINGQLQAYTEILCILDESIKEELKSCSN